jgi:hypothetical protein
MDFIQECVDSLPVAGEIFVIKVMWVPINYYTAEIENNGTDGGCHGWEPF